MIDRIGLMVGLYIITQMFSVMVRPPEKREKPFVTVMAGITIVVTVFVIASLFFIPA